MKNWAALIYSREIIFFLVCLYPPKKKPSLSAYGGSGTSGKLNSYLVDIDEQAEDTFLRLVKQIAEREGLTEQLKAENSMLWVQTMNSIRNRAMDIVNEEIIYN